MNRKDRREARARERRAGAPGSTAPESEIALMFARGGAALQAGRLAEAESLFCQVVRIDPRHADAHNWLGVACGQQGRNRDALEHFAKAAALRPGSADFASNLGLAQLNAGGLDAAQRAFETALKLNPRLAAAHHNLGLVFQRKREFDRAIACFRGAIALVPNYVNAHLNLGNALKDAERLDEAIAQYRTLLSLAPKSREAHFNLATVLQSAGRIEEAAAECRLTLGSDPSFADAHKMMGNLLTALGRFDEATASFESALALRPDYAEALHGLFVSSKKHSTPAMAARIEGLLAQNPPQDKKSTLHFALGKVYDDMGDYAKAFENYRIGNDLAVPEALFDAKIWAEFVERLTVTFTADFFAARHGFGSTSRRPVFIVGMPRSGTTLTEQIVASHPSAAPGGELIAMARIVADLPTRLGRESRFPECTAALDAATAARLAEEYLAALDAIDPGAQRVTDKMPMNFQNLGLMALLFPQATYVHCRRDPLDTCLSCYFAKFDRHLDFSYSLENLAAYYRGYRRLMDHWRKVLPVPMLELDYEALVADQETTSRRLIAHCGLPWDDRCLAFHATDRTVLTASAWQVRQPLYKGSVQRWKRYEAFLEPLRAALEKVGA